MPFTGMDGNAWQPVSGQFNQFAFDAYGGQRQPTPVDFYRAYQDIVFSCIKTIADTMAANPPKIFREKGKGGSKKFKTLRTKSSDAIGQEFEEVVDGDLLELLAAPNPRHTWHQILWIWEQQRHLFGSGYLHKKSGIITSDNTDTGSTPPRFLFIRPSFNTFPRMAPNYVDVDYYQSGQDHIAPKEIIELGFTDPLNIYGRGYSPVQACWAMLTLKQKHESFLANAYDSNGVPSAVARQTGEDTDLDEDAKRTLLLDWKAWQTRRKDAGMLIEPKGIEFTFPAPPPREIVGKTDELMTIKNAVASAFGIPFALFEVAVGNRATLDASLTQFLMLAVMPRIRERDEALTQHLARLYDENLFFRTDSPVPEDDEKKNAVFSLLASNQAVTKNELRAAYPELKLDAKPEFESVPNTQVPTSDFNFDSLPDIPDDVAEQATIAEATSTRADQSQAVLAIQSAVFGGVLPRDAGIAQLTTLFGFSSEQAAALIPPLDPKEPTPPPVKRIKSKGKKNPHEELVEILKSYFKKQHDEVMSTITTESVKAANKVSVGFDLAKANVELYSECFPTINMIAQQSIKKTLIKVKADAEDYTVISHKLKPTIRKMVLEFADSTNRTTSMNIQDAYQKVKDNIEQGIENADSLEAIRKEIGDVYTNAQDHRTYAIANTETKRAFTTSAQAAAKESGTVKGKTFLVSANACDVCQKVAGKYRDKVVPVDHAWTDDDVSPYTKGQIPLHPLCKCDEIFVLKDEYTS